MIEEINALREENKRLKDRLAELTQAPPKALMLKPKVRVVP